MRKRYLHIPLLIFSFILLGNIGYSQSHDIDSLKKLLSASNHDTNKVKYENWLSWLFSNKSYYDSAMKYAEKAILHSRQLNYKKGIIVSERMLGTIYESKGDFTTALQYYFYALNLADSVKNMKEIGRTSNSIGAILFNQGNYPDALKFYLQSLKIKEAEGDKDGEVRTLNNIGLVYKDEKSYDTSLNYFHRALNISRVIKDSIELGSFYYNMGAVLMYAGKYNEAMTNAWQALQIGAKLSNKHIMEDSYRLLGEINYSVNDIPEAKKYYNKALELNEKEDINSVFNDLAEALLKQNNIADAEAFTRKAISLAIVQGDKENLIKAYLIYSKIDSEHHNFPGAFNHFKIYTCYKDSAFNEKNTSKIVTEMMTYNFEKQRAVDEAEADAKLHSQQNVKNLFAVCLLLALIFSGIFFFQRKHIAKEKRRSDELLLNILPSETAEELKKTGMAGAKKFELVSVMFTDIKNFTSLTENMDAGELVSEINYYYSGFDRIIVSNKVEKIKTLGDGYMAAGGVPVANISNPTDIVNAAMQIQQFVEKTKAQRIKENKHYFELRIGIHTGPVVAGIVGIKKFAYDIWGDTVNTAARLEAAGEVGRVNISGATYELIKDKILCTYRGKIEVKNKGKIDMYFVESRHFA